MQDRGVPEEEPTEPEEELVDIAGVVLLVMVFACWLGIGIFAFVRGDVTPLMDPTDSDGQKCGKDALVKHKPYLMYFDITECDDAGVPIFGCDAIRVCTEECPTELFVATREENREKGLLVCRRGSLKWNRKDCAAWYLASIPYRDRCVPIDVPSAKVLHEISTAARRTIKKETLISSIRNIKTISEITSGTKYFMMEIVEKWWALICVALIILFICVVYFCIFSIFPQCLFFFSLVSVPGLLGLFLYFGISRCILYVKREAESDSTHITLNKKYMWLALSVALSIAALFLVFMTLFWIRQTFNGLGLIKICSSRLKDMFIIIVVAIICWVLHILILLFFVSVFVYLGNIDEPSTYRVSMDKSCYKYLGAFAPQVDVVACDPNFVNVRAHVINETDCKHISCEITPGRTINYLSLQFLNSVFYVWMFFFLFALEELVIGLLIYSRQDSRISCLEALRHTSTVCKCYLGTAFLGSALVALMQYACMKILFIWTARKSSSSKFISKINTCVQAGVLIEKFFGVIDTQIFIVCLLYNKNFWQCSEKFKKMIQPVAQQKLQQLGCIYYILFYQKLLVTLSCSIMAYVYVKYLVYTPTAYSFLILFFTAYLAFTTASILFSIYTIVLDVLVVSLVKDSELYNVQDDIVGTLLSE